MYCAYYYLIAYYLTNKPLDHKFAEEILKQYTDESKYIKGINTLIKASFYLYNKDYQKAIDTYKEIYLDITNKFYIDAFVSHLYSSFLNDYTSKKNTYKKLSIEKERKGIIIDFELANASALLADSNYVNIKKDMLHLIDWAIQLDCSKIKRDMIDYYYDGNYLIEKDKSKAFELLKSLNGNYADRKERFDKIFKELNQVNK